MRWTFVMAKVLPGCAGAPVSPQAPRSQPAEPEHADNPAKTLPQGIRGKVVRMVGDFTLDPPTGQKLPMAVPVHVFRGPLQPLEKPDPRHPALVVIVQAGENGCFELALPAGEYTLVAEIEGELYLNNWLEDGSWAVCIVPAGEWVDYIIQDFKDANY
ncbi:MAG: hypothetical protein AMXMBFR7_36670 [Planctomycetota bacterium]